MGGLHKTMPITALTCLAGSLALAGVFPFSGFWSKDEILVAAWTSHLPGPRRVLRASRCVAAFLTAFYIFRLWFLTFGGTPRSEAAHHAHESPAVMTLPLLALGLLAVVAGGLLIAVPGTGHGFGQLFETARSRRGRRSPSCCSPPRWRWRGSRWPMRPTRPESFLPRPSTPASRRSTRSSRTPGI